MSFFAYICENMLVVFLFLSQQNTNRTKYFSHYCNILISGKSCDKYYNIDFVLLLSPTIVWSSAINLPENICNSFKTCTSCSSSRFL